MSSAVIETFYKEVSAPSTLDFSVNLDKSYNFEPRKDYYLRFIKASVSRNFSNIYNENNTFRISYDDGVTYTTYSLQEGIYSIEQINIAIEGITLDKWTVTPDPDDPLLGTVNFGIKLDYNPVTEFCYFKIDSTKLIDAGQIKIDLSIGLFHELLGFDPIILIQDGLWTANNQPFIDFFGTSVRVILDGVSPYISVVNGSESNEICSIERRGNDEQYTENNTGSTPDIFIPSRGTISNYRVRFVGRKGRTVRIRNGECSLTFAILSK